MHQYDEPKKKEPKKEELDNPPQKGSGAYAIVDGPAVSSAQRQSREMTSGTDSRLV